MTSPLRRGASFLLGFVFAMLPAVLVLSFFDLEVNSISVPWWGEALVLLLTMVVLWLTIVYVPRMKPL
jgi:F0F1-type ATP synthase assembly protein I